MHTRAALAEWGLSVLSGDVECVVAGLVANAVEAHQRERRDAPVRLILLAGPRTVLVVVRDFSPSPPVLRTPGLDDETGRGLVIVDGLAARWDWKPFPGGGKVARALIG